MKIKIPAALTSKEAAEIHGIKYHTHHGILNKTTKKIWIKRVHKNLYKL